MVGEVLSSRSTQQPNSSPSLNSAPCAAAENLHFDPGKFNESPVQAGSTIAFQLRITASVQNWSEPKDRYFDIVNDGEAGGLCGNVDMKFSMNVVGHWCASAATADELQTQHQAPQLQNLQQQSPYDSGGANRVDLLRGQLSRNPFKDHPHELSKVVAWTARSSATLKLSKVVAWTARSSATMKVSEEW